MPAENVVVALEGHQYPVTGFQEQLCASDSRALAYYDSGWMKGSAAVCEKEYPHGGRAWYSGTGFSEQLAIILLEKAGVASPYESIIQCPPDVELAVRSGKNADWYFLLNYTETAQPIKVSSSLTLVMGETEDKRPAAPPERLYHPPAAGFR